MGFSCTLENHALAVPSDPNPTTTTTLPPTTTTTVPPTTTTTLPPTTTTTLPPTTTTTVPPTTTTTLPPSATFGNNAATTAVYATAPANYLGVGKYALAVNGSVSAMSVYGRGPSSGTQKIRLVIYSDNNGSPGALRGITDEITLSGTGNVWYSANLTGGSVSMTPGNYWLGVWFGTRSGTAYGRWYSATSGGSMYYVAGGGTYSSSGTPATPCPSGGGTAASNPCIYATFTPN